jgi:hypothetical protein
MPLYFTDREAGPQTRTREVIEEAVWGGICALISARLADNSFGHRFPEACPDGYGISGYDSHMLKLTIAAEIPQIEWPLSPEIVPPTPTMLDLLEFVAASVGRPIEGHYHSFFRHHHLDFDREAGLNAFVSDINFLFVRNGIAYELTAEGLARRLLSDALHHLLAKAMFRTGDAETDRLLELARKQFTSPHIETRRDGLEKLWDAFERVKTLEPGADKKAQANALLDRAARLRFRQMLGEEARALADIGNTFRIRHAETTQEILTTPEQIDFLFHRMFSFVSFVLKATGGRHGGDVLEIARQLFA